MKVLLISAGLFLLALAGIASLTFIAMIEPGPGGRVQYLRTTGKLLAYRYALVETLTPAESQSLYHAACTRKCHSRDVVELTPRTAIEWEQIVDRMGRPDRADLTEPEARDVVAYLQRHFLSNVPTILPEGTMRFLKRHLWRMDFGESDLYFDIIYIPRRLRHLMPYLAFNSKPTDRDVALFIVYLNTHTGLLPRWNLAEIATLRLGSDQPLRAAEWQVLYEDGQKHHMQGVLSFPAIGGTDDGEPGSLEMTIRPPAMKARRFLWRLPIPDRGEASAKAVE